MAKKQQPSALQDFVTEMGLVAKVQKGKETAQKDGRTKQVNDARKTIKDTGYEYLVNYEGVTEPKDRISYDNLETGAERAANDSLQRASNYMESDLEGIIGDIPDSKLEMLTRSKEIAEAAQDKYDTQWMELYQEHQAAQALNERAKKKNLNPEDKKALQQDVFKVIFEKRKAEHARLGFDEGRSEAAASFRLKLIQEGVLKVEDSAYVDASRKYLDESKKELETYEAAKGVNWRGYVETGLKTLAKGSTDEFNTARSLIYQAATK